MTDRDHDDTTTDDNSGPIPDPRRAAIVICYNVRTMYHAADPCPLCGSVVRYIAANRRGGCVKCSRYRVALARDRQHAADPTLRERQNAERRAAYHLARAVAEFDRLIDELDAKDEL